MKRRHTYQETTMHLNRECSATSTSHIFSRIPAILCLIAMLLVSTVNTASAVVVDGKFDASEGYGFVSDLNYKLDGGGIATGIMYSKVDQTTGDVFLFFTQPKDVVDNSYGAKDGTPGTHAGANNSIGWDAKSGLHKFKELRDSDKARLRITDGSGAQVLDFTLDYLADFAGDDSSDFGSAGILSTKDGTAPAGVLKAEGGIDQGNPAHILAVETTLGYNFDTFGPDSLHFGEDSHSPAVDQLVDYPVTVTEAGFEDWIFEVGYEMQIDGDAFGTNGFGEVQDILINVHDSPVKQKLLKDEPAVIGEPTPLDATADLGDRVWFDANENGLQDAGELGAQSVKVTLTGGGLDGIIGQGGDDTMDMTFTDITGLYLFPMLNVGEEYKVTFSELPAGYTFTTPNVGGDDLIDSDAVMPGGMTQIVTLAAGESNLSLDAGLVLSSLPEPQTEGVPEPSTFILAALGMMTLGMTRRRRRERC